MDVSPTPPAPPPWLRRLAPPVLLALMAVLLVTSGLHKRLSYDEADNLSYGYRFLRQGPGAVPQGQRMPVLALNALACAPRQCRLSHVDGTELRRLGARAPTMLFTLALGLLVHAWAGRLFGGWPALAALWLYVFNPSFLAHGKQVTSDVQASAFVAAAVWLLWRLVHRPAPAVFLATAVATAAAVASKMTNLLLVPVLAVLAAASALGRRTTEAPAPASLRRAGRAAGLAAAFTVLVVLLINAVYLFDGSLRPASAQPWRSRALQPLGRLDLPLLLPSMFLWTVDRSYVVQENPLAGRGPNYVLGELNHDGRWYAFPLMVLLKTPLALFALLGWALVGLLRERPRRRELPFLLLPPVAWLAFFSLMVKPQIGVRYLLPVFPFLIVLAARAARPPRGRLLRSLLAALLAWHALSALSYHPHYMAYFNELIGRRVNAYKYLADSNLDWEDASHFIAEFKREHPEISFVYEPPQPQAGYVLVRANALVGLFERERYRWLRENFEPVGQVAYSHLLFYVPPERLKALRPTPPAP